MNFKPLGERVLLKVQEAETTTASGIIIPDNASNEKPTQANVLAVGSEVKEVEVGDRVIFSQYAKSTKVTVTGEECIVMELNEILGVMK